MISYRILWHSTGSLRFSKFESEVTRLKLLSKVFYQRTVVVNLETFSLDLINLINSIILWHSTGSLRFSKFESEVTRLKLLSKVFYQRTVIVNLETFSFDLINLINSRILWHSTGSLRFSKFESEVTRLKLLKYFTSELV